LALAIGIFLSGIHHIVFANRYIDFLPEEMPGKSGRVYLTFVLSSGGMLKQLQIIDSKTSANEYLRNVALKSIKESSPFPPFPIGFDYPEFTFNLLISFQD